MPRVGVRDLKNQTTQILRDVRENRAEYVITYHGRPMAVLLPVSEGWLEAETQRAIEMVRPGEDVWDELEALRREIDQKHSGDRYGGDPS